MYLHLAVPRRIALVTCCAVLAASSALLTACGSDSDSKSSSATTQATQAPTESITIGVDPTTMPYAGKKGSELIGMDTDVAKAMAKQANVDGKITELTFDNAVPALKAGRADVSFVGGWYGNAERLAQMNVISYYKAAVGFVIKAGSTKVGPTWEGRCGDTLATYGSSPSYLAILTGDNKKCMKAGKKAITIKKYAGLSQGVLAVRSGRIDGMLDAIPAVAYQAKLNPALGFVEVTDQDPVVWQIGVAKNNLALATKLAKAVDAMRQSGELAKIWESYGLPSSMNLDKVTLNNKPI